MLEYDSYTDWYRYGGLFYEGYEEGRLGTGAEVLVDTAAYAETDAYPGIRALRDILPQELMIQAENLRALYDGKSRASEKAAAALWKETEYIPSYTVYAKAQRMRGAGQKPDGQGQKQEGGDGPA